MTEDSRARTGESRSTEVGAPYPGATAEANGERDETEVLVLAGDERTAPRSRFGERVRSRCPLADWFRRSRPVNGRGGPGRGALSPASPQELRGRCCARSPCPPPDDGHPATQPRGPRYLALDGVKVLFELLEGAVREDDPRPGVLRRRHGFSSGRRRGRRRRQRWVKGQDVLKELRQGGDDRARTGWLNVPPWSEAGKGRLRPVLRPAVRGRCCRKLERWSRRGS